MKADERVAWQRLPGSERIRAVMDLNLELWAMKGEAVDPPRLQRTMISFQRWTIIAGDSKDEATDQD